MGKKLAIKSHPTRGKEVIELLEMMGGVNWMGSLGNTVNRLYYIYESKSISYDDISLKLIDEYEIFTLEEFLEKYPFKVGDKVQVLKSGKVFTIGNMIWDDEVCNIYYYNTDDIEYYNAEELKLYKETDTVKPVTNKSERTHEDVIFDSIIWHLRNSVNNGKQNLSGGECEDYFREVVKKNNENKMSDCKKCGLGFGSVRCFDKDCPHNTPKSYAVGLKDGKVIDCIANKETDMNEIKPLFKTGDVVKLKGCPDKNFFWIVMDVIEDGYIFNGGEKCSFDDQHHYEKTNMEVINAPDITAKVTNKNHKMGPKSKLPSKYYEEKQTKRDIDKSEFIIKHMILPNKMDDKLEYEIIDGYEFEKVENNKIILKPIKPKYPTTYEECWKVRFEVDGETTLEEFHNVSGYYSGPLGALQKLLCCRDAYWKIAGEQMGLDNLWEPDWSSFSEGSYPTITKCNGMIVKTSIYTHDCPFAFPSAEMRDAFYENFKDLFEQCKELL